jgi:purine-nucleoside phosphorylase
MEAFALFANARYLKKSAATILTVSRYRYPHMKRSQPMKGESALITDDEPWAMESVTRM